MNTLYFGNNLPILREKIRDESVDLIYLDPPFNSKAAYNVLFPSPTGARSTAQDQAFVDTWQWGDEAVKALEDVGERNLTTFRLLEAIRSSLGDNSDIMAYLAMMAVRLIEMHRALKASGSLYLHCDPTASHYLKMILDAIFRPENFRSEIIWRRTGSHHKISKQYGPIHDTIFFYSKSDEFVFHPGVTPYTKSYIKMKFRYEDERGAYRLNEIMGPGKRTGESGMPWRGFDPSDYARHWAIPQSLKDELPPEKRGFGVHKTLDDLHELGFIHLSRSGRPEYKQYPGGGIPYQDIWAFQPGTDGVLFGSDDEIDKEVKWLETEQERIGYPTQKPVGLLSRIIETSSDPGQVVLDPFCGCGTAIHAAEKLGRQWIGIDITYLAIHVIEDRLKMWLPAAQYQVIGVPEDEHDARKLAAREPYQFQLWAVGKLRGAPRGRGADRGVDGEIAFKTGAKTYGRGVVSVKAGRNVGPLAVRELVAVAQREGADIGYLVSLDAPTPDMRADAASAGRFELHGEKVFRIQLVSVKQLLDGQFLKLPAFGTISAAAEARQSRARRERQVTPEDLRQQPQMKLPIRGGKKGVQPPLPLPEPILSSEPPPKRPPAAAPAERRPRRKRAS